MSIPTLDLDDRSFDDLVREGLALLPTVAPQWTNHNPSDPGVTIIELLAYFTEILVYRIGRISPASKVQFLKLLTGSNWEGLAQDKRSRFLRLLAGAREDASGELETAEPADVKRAIEYALVKAGPDELSQAIEYIVHDVTQNECAVTAADFERFAATAASRYLESARVRTLCIPGVDLETGRPPSRTSDNRAHVSIVVAPERELTPHQAAKVNETVKKDLLPRCLLTTRIHVVAPIYLYLAIRIALALKPGHLMEHVSRRIRDNLTGAFGDGFGQGRQDNGWPFGRPLHVSEVVGAIDATPGVDFVDDITILQMTTESQNLDSTEAALGIQIDRHSTIGVDTLLGGPGSLGPGRLQRNDEGKLVSIVLRPWELLRLQVAEGNIVPIAKKKTSGGNNG
ncbi:hypothetical protein [Nitrosospira sp. Is2]|uniref:hypothetical protein n=1 Tax=Nitrosospira sp. Is2 TaxID=3080532 RepID=UPI002955B0B3|nr:hypothetical protein [Nitrosospira sp. Is2]WON73519.1 hypothetical protein R5L00_13715 [Nitrosospira sp. Is2]